MKQTLKDFGLIFENTTIFCDNTSAVNLSKNPILHSRTKHIQIRHHFLREQVLNNIIELEFIPTNQQLTDIFTKPLKHEDFIRIKKRIENL